MAVMAVPIMAAVGMAVDYSRINAARTAFQVALDATALMMSKNAATETDAQRQTEATNTFNSLCAGQIVATFGQIGTSLSKLRLAM